MNCFELLRGYYLIHVLYLIFLVKVFSIRNFFIRIFLIRIFSIGIRRNFYVFSNILRHLFFFNNIIIFFSKYLIIIMTCSKNRLDQNCWYTNTLRTFFWYFVIVKNCFDFTLLRFHFSFQMNFILNRFFFDAFVIFFQILLYFSINSLSSIKKTYIWFHQSLSYMYSFSDEICLKVYVLAS